MLPAGYMSDYNAACWMPAWMHRNIQSSDNSARNIQQLYPRNRPRATSRVPYPPRRPPAFYPVTSWLLARGGAARYILIITTYHITISESQNVQETHDLGTAFCKYSIMYMIIMYMTHAYHTSDSSGSSISRASRSGHSYQELVQSYCTYYLPATSVRIPTSTYTY